MTQINWQYQVNNRAGGYIVTATDWNDLAGNFRSFVDQTTGSGTTDNVAMPIGVDLVNHKVFISDPTSATACPPEAANNTATAQLQVSSNAQDATIAITAAHDTEATSAVLLMRKADGTQASPALVDDDAVLGTIRFQGYDGNSWANGATIQALVDGTAGDGDMPTELIFSTSADGAESPTARMAIGPDGNVGIGTTGPDQPLHIVTSGTDAYIKQDDGTTATVSGPDGSSTGLWGTTTNHPIRFITNNTERFRIDTSGLITSPRSYSATTGNSANLVVYDSGGGFYRSTSSRKYKTDIEDMQDSWADKILGLRPVWYRSTCEPDNDKWSYWGFIAEEVEDVDPRLVQHDNDGTPEGVQYDRLVPHLVNLLKRQDERIKALEAS